MASIHVEVLDITKDKVDRLTEVPDNIKEMAELIVKDAINEWQEDLEDIDIELMQDCFISKPYIPGVIAYIECRFGCFSSS